MKRHANIRVLGRVQGVLFRDSARRNAKKLNLSGFVRNEPNGSVYIEAEGEEENLKEFLEWCRKGPFFARVDKMESETTIDVKNYPDFVIEYGQ